MQIRTRPPRLKRAAPSHPLIAGAADARVPERARGARRAAAIVGAVALLAIVLIVGVRGGVLDGEPEGLVFVIPAGAKEQIARPGFDTAIAIPTDIRFAADEPAVITVRNLDDVAHRAGPFLVGPMQTYVQRFPEPGRYPIACNVNPLESVVVTVEA